MIHAKENVNKRLLILDLDETLIHATTLKNREDYDFCIFDYYVYKRPYLNTFLKEVNIFYHLAIWSSASDDYVHEIVQKIFPSEVNLQFVWGRSRCTPKRISEIDEDDRYYFHDSFSHHFYTKQLKKIKRMGFQLEHVLIVDDSPEKVANAYGNAIYIKEFIGDSDDRELLALLKYLVKIHQETNFRKIEKRNWKASVD
ncbi:MAG: HAD family hydrolase [Chitinophagales bacterium]|nr:HAD family hydrolase [Chitinophagales bacterium]